MSAPDLCRVTVVGPDRRVDLAVPLSLPVAALMPALLRHTSTSAEAAGPVEHPGDGWVLQRLGQPPMSGTETPASLHWLEGERLFLRRHEHALPQRLVDDIADGVAESVGAGPGRWLPEHSRRLFAVLAALAGAVVLSLPLRGAPSGDPALAALLAGLAGLVAAPVVARMCRDDALAGVLGTLGGLGLAVAAALHRPGGRSMWTPTVDQVTVAGLAAAGAAVALLVVGIGWGGMTRWAPFGVLGGVGALAASAGSMHSIMAWDGEQVAGAAATAMIGVLIFSPRAVARVAGLRVPQLPRTSAELQFDIEPMTSAEVQRRAAVATECLTAVTISAAVALGWFGVTLMTAGGFATALGAVVALATAIRAAATRSVGQRLALTGAVAVLAAALAESVAMWLPPGWQWVEMVALAAGLAALLTAMCRPPGRRMAPIWLHLANGLETLTAVALVPLLLQLFGVYAWALGLIG